MTTEDVMYYSQMTSFTKKNTDLNISALQIYCSKLQNVTVKRTKNTVT